MKTQNIKTYLPVFSGFYHGYFEEDREIEYFIWHHNDEPQDKERILTWDDIEFDYNTYQDEVAKFMCKFVAYELQDFGVLSIEFEQLRSPKYYNYDNDTIDCIIKIEPKKIQEYIKKHEDEFSKYIKENYTSRDGFISYYSCEFWDWAWITKEFTDFENCHVHYLGSILQFICQNEEITESQACQEFWESRWIGEYIEIKEIETELN